MGPRSRSITPRRSFSKSPGHRNGRKKSHSRQSRDKVYDFHSRSGSRQPPSPPPLPPTGRNGRRNGYSGESKSSSRSPSPRHNRRRTHSRSPQHDQRRGTREKPLQNRCIGVFGLNVYTTQLKIREIFSKFGPIERIQVVVDAQTGRSRGFCFIYYDNIADAKTAKDACSGIQIDDRRIRVDYSTTQRPHTPTPGVYMGRSTRIHRDRDDDYHDRYRDEYRAPRRRSPSPHSRSSHRSERRHRYERSRSRSYTPPRRSRY